LKIAFAASFARDLKKVNHRETLARVKEVILLV
jgi:hypothetical protein